jgi:hypothetical protein
MMNLRIIKVCSMASFGGKVKIAPCHKISRHVKKPAVSRGSSVSIVSGYRLDSQAIEV